jgi:hypothetical protein
MRVREVQAVQLFLTSPPARVSKGRCLCTGCTLCTTPRRTSTDTQARRCAAFGIRASALPGCALASESHPPGHTHPPAPRKSPSPRLTRARPLRPRRIGRDTTECAEAQVAGGWLRPIPRRLIPHSDRRVAC